VKSALSSTPGLFKQVFGSGLGQAVTIGAMAAWLRVPLGLGVRRFGRKNF